MSILTNAFQHALNARERVVGVREKINLNGVDVDAIVETITSDEVFVAGGIAEAGGFRCQIATNAVQQQPNDFDPIIIRNRILQVLMSDDINGIVYHITVGDPVVEK
jgi:hypothetical protein